MDVIKPYSFDEAIERSRIYADKSERDLWIANELLKRQIEECSFSGGYEATIEYTIYDLSPAFSNINEVEATVGTLADVYEEEGYHTKVTPLKGYCHRIEGFRLEVNW